MSNTVADWEKQADVIVVGSGFAGLAAAIEAANAGAFPVTIVEKMPTPGGNSIYNAGQIAAVGSKQQEQAHIEDSASGMIKDMLSAGLDMNHFNLLLKMIESSNEIVEWTEVRRAMWQQQHVSSSISTWLH
jgi:succinate dehydrogenase/fumarate reductase flavoprotein subunit